MKKIKILEFRDPFAKSTSGLKPAIVSNTAPTATASSTKPSLRDVITGDPDEDIENLDPIDPDTGEKIKDPRPRPSPQSVASDFNVNPNDYEAQMVNCLDDLKANWHWYFAYGAFYCWALYPAVKNIISLARATGGAVAAPIETAKKIADNSKAALEKVRSSAQDIKDLPQDAHKKITDVVDNKIDQKGPRFKDLPEKLASKAGLLKKYGFPAYRAGRVISAWMLAGAIVMNYGPESVSKWLKGLIFGSDNPNEKDSLAGGALSANFQTAMFADSWLKFLSLV